MALRIDAARSDASADAAHRSVAPSSGVGSRFPEIFFAAEVLILVTLQVVEQCRAFHRMPGQDWNSSEWMIDYAGGFVRRGLSGAFMAQTMRLTHWGFLPIWITITTAAYLGLCLYILNVSRRLGGSALWRFALLMNPVLFLSVAYYSTIGRKDTLFLCGTLLIVLLGHRALRREMSGNAARTSQTVIVLLATLIVSVILALLHEGIFLFAWLPLNFTVVGYVLSRLQWKGRRVAILLSLTFGPALLAVAISAHSHGDAHTAQAICLSWRSFGIPTTCSVGDNFPPAVDALSWSFSRGLSLSLRYSLRLPVFIALLLAAGSVEIIAVRALIPKARLAHLIPLLALPLLASSPLFLLGVDWGRWISLIATSSLIVMLSSELRPAIYCSLPTAVREQLSRYREADEVGAAPVFLGKTGHKSFDSLYIDRRNAVGALMRGVASPVDAAFASLRRLAERHRWLFCAAVFLLPVPPTPALGSMLVSQPVAVFLFLRHLLIR